MRPQRDWQNLVASSQTMVKTGMRGWGRVRIANSPVLMKLSLTTCYPKVGHLFCASSRSSDGFQEPVTSKMRSKGYKLLKAWAWKVHGITSAAVYHESAGTKFKAKGHRHIFMGKTQKIEGLKRISLQIQCNTHQNSSKILHRPQKDDTELRMEIQSNPVQ